MKRFNLPIDFGEVRERINIEKQGVKPGEWAKRIGVSPQVVSTIHGKTKQDPSFQYIIAVAYATGRSVDYFLWGEDAAGTAGNSGEPGKANIRYLNHSKEEHWYLQAASEILASGRASTIRALKESIKELHQRVKQTEELEDLKARIEVLETAVQRGGATSLTHPPSEPTGTDKA